MVIEKQGLPNEFTQGEVGDIYIDTDTGFKFECTSKISIKAGADIDIKYIWTPVRENYKKMVDDACTALSDKLQTEVSKDGLIEAIGGINIGGENTIVSAIAKIVSDNNLNLEDIVYTNTTIIGTYTSNVLLRSIKADNATSTLSDVFQYCISLQNVDMPKVTSIGSNAFRYCISLQNVDIPMITSIGTDSFEYCLSLQNIDMSRVASIKNNVFTYCISLQNIDMSSATVVGDGAFQFCISLQNVDMPKVSTIYSKSFYKCHCLKTVKISYTTVTTLNNVNAFEDTPIANGTGYIYVPDELVNDYKVATNWSVYADQIRPMSEYVEEVNE